MEEKAMKKVITVLSLTMIVFVMFASVPSYAGTDPLLSETTYYTEETDYIPGDCILTATRMMIRRAAIMNGKTGWDEITNEVLRPEATTMDGCLLSDFCFESEGMIYRIGFGTFSGTTDAERIGEFEALLREHPEGIVVHGDWAASTGTHGVLVVGVEGGEVYAVDASYNMGIFSEGIQKWSDTTMLEPSLVTRYWYISSITKTVEKPKPVPAATYYFNILRCA